MSRRVLGLALAVVGAFAAVGAGVGLAMNFTLGFFIEQFVDPGTAPLDVTQVAIMFLVAVFSIYALAPVVAGAAGVFVGRSLPDRDALAGAVSAAGGFVGFFPYAGFALFLVVSVLSEYGTGSGGASGGPLEPSSLVTLTLQVSLPVGLVGLVVGYLVSRLGVTDTQEPTQRDGHPGADSA